MTRKGGSKLSSKKRMRSGLEEKVRADLESRKIPYEYESIKLKYNKEICSNCGHTTKRGTYTPDFIILRPNRIRLVVETKGRFTGTDREKHKRVKRDNPEEDIRFVFQRNQPIRKGSSTTYTDWCDKHGFQWAIEKVPEEWVKDAVQK